MLYVVKPIKNSIYAFCYTADCSKDACTSDSGTCGRKACNSFSGMCDTVACNEFC